VFAALMFVALVFMASVQVALTLGLNTVNSRESPSDTGQTDVGIDVGFLLVATF
jgi:hypothetical protein